MSMRKFSENEYFLYFGDNREKLRDSHWTISAYPHALHAFAIMKMLRDKWGWTVFKMPHAVKYDRDYNHIVANQRGTDDYYGMSTARFNWNCKSPDDTYMLILKIDVKGTRISTGTVKNSDDGFMFFRDSFVYKDKYQKETYVEKKMVQLWMKRCLETAMELGYSIQPTQEDCKTDEERIVWHRNHIDFRNKEYPRVNSFEDIILDEKEGRDRPGEYNSKDMDGNVLHGGDVRYAYGYDHKIIRGVVAHNINNMWWLKCSDGKVRNIACFELFDERTALRWRKSKEYCITRATGELKNAKHENDFKKAEKLFRYCKSSLGMTDDELRKRI